MSPEFKSLPSSTPSFVVSSTLLTEKIIFNFKNKTKEVEDEDDE